MTVAQGSGPWNARFDHIALVTPKREESRRMFEEILGAVVERDEAGSGIDPRTTTLNLNGTSVHILQPLSDEGVIGKFLARRGPAIHHLA